MTVMPRLCRLLAPLAAAAVLTSAAPVPSAPLSATFDWFDYRGADPLPAGTTQGPDEYRNPILQGFYPDPSITRVGDDYYLVNSSFSWFPGLPVFHSRDLVHWTQIANAIDRPDQVSFDGLGMSRGLYAPAITAHDGTFYIVNTCVDCGGNYVITAKNPAGPWSDPVFLPQVRGIDPSLFFDTDGTAWIVNNDAPPEAPRYDGHRAIWIQQFDPKTLTTTGPRTVLVDGGVAPDVHPVWIEGPHLFRKDGWIYLICAQGGTGPEHSEVVLRSRHVTGPYVPGPDNPILTQRDLPPDRPQPITSAGHAGFVETPTGQWWATFLATRPYGDDLYNTGRETFLLPVTWHDGWPQITAPGTVIPWVHRRPDLPAQPAPAVPMNGAFHIRQDFSGGRLPLQWMMARQPHERWYHLTAGTPGLTLDARPVGLADLGNPSMVARRQQHLHATASTALHFVPRRDGDRAGLVAFQNDDYWFFLGIEQIDGKPMIRLDRHAGKDDPVRGVEIAQAPLPGAAGAPIRLSITADGGSYTFRYASAAGQWRTLADKVDGSILSTHVAGGFVGAMFGLYAGRTPVAANPSP